ncbi:MAG: flagellar biosynthesis anti-sigma factor FlgM [Desulfobacterota bacterium]|nr:flagellar biosynthesis anti-sigma factor FlgM [Thermodesulfobacteriota bacterium]
MKIHNEESIRTVEQLRKSTAEQTAKTRKISTPSTDGDHVELSDKAREFSRIKDVLETVPDVRSDKVKALSEAVERGTYTVDTRDVAGKIIRESIIDILA